MADELDQAFEIFYSYAHEDASLRETLEKHLSTLKWQKLITSWYDRNISAGQERAHEIDSHLNSAHIILLLVSVDFIASEYCWSVEVTRAMERHHRGEARVIPIILRPADWKDTPFGHLQVLPATTKPITSWPNLDEAFLHVVEEIRSVIAQLKGQSPRNRSSSFPIQHIPYGR